MQPILNEYFTDSKRKHDPFDAEVIYTLNQDANWGLFNEGGLMRNTVRTWVTSHRQEMRNWVSRGGPLRLVVHIIRLVS